MLTMRDDIESAIRLVNDRNDHIARRAEAGAWIVVVIAAGIALAFALRGCAWPT